MAKNKMRNARRNKIAKGMVRSSQKLNRKCR